MSATGVALLASLAAHALAAATAGVVLPRILRGDGQDVVVEVDLASIDPAVPTDPPPPPLPVASTSAPPPHTRLRVTSARAMKSTARVAYTAAPPDVAPQPPLLSDTQPARFAIPAGTLGTLGVAAPSGEGSLTGGANAIGRSAGNATVLPERDVNVPARLIHRDEVSYPPAARAAEVEADVPLEIVLDTEGRVVTARGLSRYGYGLDEAALQAIRTYRFSPALRDGSAVRVRMRWIVQFRLH